MVSTTTRQGSAHRTHRGMVVVVDDDPDLRAELEAVLTDAGYLVLVARDGEEALCRMRGLVKGVLAIVDLSMPGMDGRALIASMRADPDLREIPVVVVTGSLSPVPGVEHLLRKPFEPEALLARVEELLGR